MHRTGLSTVLTQGLFPSNFVTTDLDSDVRGERKRSVVFNEEVGPMINFKSGHRGVFYSEYEYLRTCGQWDHSLYFSWNMRRIEKYPSLCM